MTSYLTGLFLFDERGKNIKGLGILLKEKRIEEGLTLETLSKLTDISISTLSKLENGKLKRPSSVFLFRLSKVLGMLVILGRRS